MERTIRLAAVPDQEGVRLTQSYSESNADGEIIFWSWNDGNDATWEGTIYVEVYSDGSASTWEGQIDASTEDHPWVYYTKTWEKKPREPLPVRLDQPPMPGQMPRIVTADLDLSGRGFTRQYRQVGFYEWAVCWRACVVGGCTAAALGCRFSGPGWPGCFGAWCVGAEVGCALTCFLAK